MKPITHVSRIGSDLRELNEIPSEFIEPYIVTYFSMVIESVAFGFDTPEQARLRMKEIDRFVYIFCGIHARLATSNQVHDFCRMTDEQMIKICKETFKDFNN